MPISEAAHPRMQKESAGDSRSMAGSAMGNALLSAAGVPTAPTVLQAPD